MAASVRAGYVVYVTKGLADVAEAELLEIAPRVRVRLRSDRFLVVDACAAECEHLGTSLRTADDVRLLVSGPHLVQTAGDLASACREAEHRVRALLADVQLPDAEDGWSVTLSARKPPWRQRPAWEPGPVIARHLH
ncbi:MAG: hypothetical protein ACRDNF_23630, partial [Streptosporangiaceae bacterium]